MKLSNQPTAHILVKARTNSEWDSCSFALIELSEAWKKEQTARLEAVKPFANDSNFSSINFYDVSVEFYQAGVDGEDTADLLEDRDWAFVELDADEQDQLVLPENSLDCYMIVVRSTGMARYKAYGKHTDEEFWTSKIPLQELTGHTIS